MNAAAREGELLRDLASELLLRVDDIAASLSAEVLRRHPELASPSDPAALAALRRSSSANVGAAVSTLAFGVAPDSVDPPEGVLDLVNHVACAPEGLPVLLRAYWLGAATARRHIVEHLGARVDDPATLTRLIILAGTHIDGYTDHVTESITRRWTQISQEALNSGRRREAGLRALLRGEDVPPDTLDHPLQREHFAVAVRSAQGAFGAVRRALDEVCGRYAGAAVVELIEPDGTHLMWVSPARPVAGLDRLTDAAPPGVHLAVSGPDTGPAGFVQAAQEATDTMRALVRLRPKGGAATYAQLALAATLLADPKRAQRLARTVLGPLSEPGTEAVRLRATLRAYFAAQESKVAAAATLGIHEKTVAYRLRRAAQLLGDPVENRRADLEAALLAVDTP